jgi:hypothetical protein
LRGKRDYVVLNGFMSELLGKNVVVKSIDDPENIKTFRNRRQADFGRVNGYQPGPAALFFYHVRQ